MAGEKKRLLDNFLSLGALQIVGYIFPLINLPYLSRVLGADKFGLVFFAFAFMQYFIVLTDFGFGLSATREIAVNRHNQNNLSNIFNSVFCVKMILTLISFIMLCLIVFSVPKLKADWLIFILSFFMVIGNAIYPVWFFQGMERMRYMTLLNILAKALFVILIFVFVKKQSDYIIVPVLNSAGFIVSGLIGIWFAIKEFKIKLYIPKISTMRKQLKYSGQFFLSRVANTFYTNTNSFCLGLISSNLMVAYYVAAEKIYQAVGGFNAPITGSLYPYVAKNRDIKTYKKIFCLVMMADFFVCSFIFIFAKDIITIFYGQELTEAYKVLRIFTVILLVSMPSVLMGFPLLAALGHTKIANNSVIISSFIHIVGLFLLYFVHHLNIYSIAIMVLVTTCFELAIRMYGVIKYKLLKIDATS